MSSAQSELADLQKLFSEGCKHEGYPREIRYQVDSLGRKSYKWQCLRCGWPTGGALKVRDVVHALGSITKAAPFDELISKRIQGLREQYMRRASEDAAEARQAEWEDEQEEQRRIRQAIDREWWAIYTEYLRTPEWTRKSKAVIARDGMCRACNGHPAKEAHHITYTHVFNEPLFDLVGLCHDCHDDITHMDRERRGLSRIEIARAWKASRS